VAHDFNVAKLHSHERIASKVATVDSVAQFRAANRAAHRREQRKKAFYSALFFAALSAGAVEARYWFTHKPELLAATPAPQLRSVAQKIARALPAKAANTAEASTIDSTAAADASASDDQNSAPADSTTPALTSDGRTPVAQVANQSSAGTIAQGSVQSTEPDTQVAVRHGSTLATIRKSKADDPGEEPVALPLRVAETASLAKPEALKDVVADVPTHTAVLAAQVPKKAVPARLIHSVPAQYPPMARQLHVEGEVMLEVNVDPSGAVSNVKALSGPPLLRTAAIDCVKRWKYQAATLGDKPVPSTESVKVDFHWR
jgi:TonB family protein